MANISDENLQQDIENAFAEMISRLTQITGLPSQWNGQVEIVHSAGRAFGGKTFNCLIRIRADIASQAVGWPTLIHEAFHCFSVERSPDASLTYPGYEEGVVEALQRLFREELLADMGIAAAPEAFLDRDNHSAYTDYIGALETMRGALEADAKQFYLSLLATPLEQRWAVLREQAQSLAEWQETRFRREWRQKEQVLEGDFDA